MNIEITTEASVTLGIPDKFVAEKGIAVENGTQVEFLKITLEGTNLPEMVRELNLAAGAFNAAALQLSKKLMPPPNVPRALEAQA